MKTEMLNQLKSMKRAREVIFDDVCQTLNMSILSARIGTLLYHIVRLYPLSLFVSV
jgi:hypothetical protein